MGKRVKIIMNHDVMNVGEEGDVCEVSSGYARNYLLPQKLAVPVSKHALEILNQRKTAIEKRKAEKRVQAQSIKDKIQHEVIVFSVQSGEHGKLFGSITSGHIAEELQKRGYSIEKKKIDVPEHHIKSLGDYTIKVKLYGNEEASFKVTVKPLEVKEETKEEARVAGKKTEEKESSEPAETEAAPETETASS
ncbi:MAG: 50S ribosomal protein L9 [Spirochaetaceae bacterium]|nr:MAG: 50S ribosomal protein L9 [Spirochaetaceae bacterium]